MNAPDAAVKTTIVQEIPTIASAYLKAEGYSPLPYYDFEFSEDNRLIIYEIATSKRIISSVITVDRKRRICQIADKYAVIAKKLTSMNSTYIDFLLAICRRNRLVDIIDVLESKEPDVKKLREICSVQAQLLIKALSDSEDEESRNILTNPEFNLNHLDEP